MRLREAIAWCLVVVSVITICSLAITLPGQGLTASERKAMDMSDALEQRMYQNVSSVATVMNAAGTGGTASVDGNDAVGQVNITTGSNPGTGSLVHITFRSPYKTQPFVMVTPEDAAPPVGWYVTIDTNGWDIVVDTPQKPHANYPFAYLIAPRPWLMYSGQSRLPLL